MKAALKNIKQFVINVMLFNDYSFNVLKLLWNYKHIPISIQYQQDYKFGCLIVRHIGFKKDTKLPVKLKVPKPICIMLGYTNNKDLRLTAYLHELGHYEDRHNISKLSLQKLEVRAWNIAFDLCKKYNLNLNKEFAKQSLESYKVNTKKLNNFESINLPKDNKISYNNV